MDAIIIAITFILLLFSILLNREAKLRISELMKTNEELREREKNFRSLAENSLDYIIRFNNEYNILYMNPAALRRSGFREEDIVGKTHRELGYDDQSCELWEDALAQVFHSGKPCRMIFEWEHVKGKIYLDQRLFPESDDTGNVKTVLGISRDITDMKQAEKALYRSQEMLSKIFQSSPAIISVTTVSESRFLDVNETFLKLFGYSKKEVIGKTSSELNIWADEHVRNNLKTSLYNRRKDILYEALFRKKNNELFYGLVSLTPINIDGIDSILTVGIDISDRKQMEKLLRQNEKELKLTLEATTDGIWKWNFCTDELFFSDRYYTMLGYEPNEFPANFESWKKLIHPNDYDAAVATAENYLKSAPDLYENEFRLKTKSGDFRWIRALGRIVERDKDGKPLRMIGNHRDITERRHSEAETKKLESRLRQAQSMEAIGTLAGGIAHDFNNILFPIIGYTEMTMSSMPKDSRAYKNLDEILKAALRAKELVNQILTFSRQREHEKVRLKIQSVIKEVLKLIRSTLPATIKIVQQIDPNCSPVMADPTQIHQVIMNLCTNAYHAMENTGGILEVTLTEIGLNSEDLSAYPNALPGNYLKLSVSDSGMGIPKNIIERIFEPFFTTKPTGKGTGLGLAVVHGIVNQMGGHIRVYSEPEKGTAFHVYLPAIPSDASPVSASADSDEVIPRGTERILLVDDEEPILKMLMLMLGELGYVVTPSSGSVEAFRSFEHQPDNFDLIITDMTMPNMTGVQLARKITDIRPDIPIVLCTGFSEQINGERSQMLNIKGYLMKPILRRELAKMIREVLKK